MEDAEDRFSITHKTIPLRDIIIREEHMDREIDDEGVDRLSVNIKQVGLINPITVRKIPRSTQYSLLGGKRRLLALLHLKRKTAACRVYECGDDEAEFISLSENMHTKKPTTVEFDAAVKRMFDLLRAMPHMREPENNSSPTAKPPSRTKQIQRLSDHLAVSTTSVDNSLRRQEKLVPAAKRALAKGHITQAQANMLAKLSPDDQRGELPHMLHESAEDSQNRIHRRVIAGDNKDQSFEEIRVMLRSILVSSQSLKKAINVLRENMGKKDYMRLAGENPDIDALIDLLRLGGEFVAELHRAARRS